MMKDKRASHTTREKDSSYKQNKDTGRNEKRPKSMQAKRRNPAQHSEKESTTLILPL